MSAKSKNSSGRKKFPIDHPFDPAVLRQAKDLASQYRIIIEEDSEEGYGGTVLEMQTVWGFGKTPNECVKETRELLISALAFMIERGDAVPPPASQNQRTEQVNIRLTAMEKASLEQKAESGGYRGVSDYIRQVTLGGDDRPGRRAG